MSWTKLIQKAIVVRMELHKIPEPCWQEKATSAAIGKILSGLGIDWRPCAGTGIVAQVAQEAKGERLALRTDMDGLLLEEVADAPVDRWSLAVCTVAVMTGTWPPCWQRRSG